MKKINYLFAVLFSFSCLLHMEAQIKTGSPGRFDFGVRVGELNNKLMTEGYIAYEFLPWAGLVGGMGLWNYTGDLIPNALPERNLNPVLSRSASDLYYEDDYYEDDYYGDDYYYDSDWDGKVSFRLGIRLHTPYLNVGNNWAFSLYTEPSVVFYPFEEKSARIPLSNIHLGLEIYLKEAIYLRCNYEWQFLGGYGAYRGFSMGIGFYL